MSDMQQVHQWFLHRGLPLVLPRRIRSRDLIERSAPMLSGVGALMVMAIFVVLMPVIVSGWSGAAAAEAPVFVLISLLAIWQVIGFLAIVALIFVVTTIRDEVRALRDDRAEQSDPKKLLAGTPLAAVIDHTPAKAPLSKAEQFNVVAVMVVAEAIQVVLFTAGLFAFFLALGIIAISDEVAVLWASETTCAVGEPPCSGTWFGIHIPIPQTIIQTSLFVAVLSGLYFTVSTSVDPFYRKRLFEPLIADVAVSLAGRDAYLAVDAKIGELAS